MAMFPITGRFVGDFVPHLVVVDTEDAMDQVAEKVAMYSVGHRIPKPADPPGYDVLLRDELLPPTTTLAEVMTTQDVLPLQWFDVRFREPVKADA